MSDILGYDCDGKPLRAGDRAIIVRVGAAHWNYMVGREYTIIGPCPVYHDQIEFDEPAHNPRWKWVSGSPRSFRKIDQTETGDWSEIEKQTGWRPRIEAEA